DVGADRDAGDGVGDLVEGGRALVGAAGLGEHGVGGAADGGAAVLDGLALRGRARRGRGGVGSAVACELDEHGAGPGEGAEPAEDLRVLAEGAWCGGGCGGRGAPGVVGRGGRRGGTDGADGERCGNGGDEPGAWAP